MNALPSPSIEISPGVFRYSILDNLNHQRRTDAFPEAKGVLRKCSCRCVWCAVCHKRFFMPIEEKKMAGFDWKRTRHVVLTVGRTDYKTPSEAYLYVTEGKKLAEFIKGLKKGFSVKRGNDWVVKYPPANISKWYWALEWHSDGYPHWHLLIEVAEEGQIGMIGGDMIRHFWKLGWIRETYFHSKAHFKNIVGYYGKHGYFERNKAYQGLLPEEIKIALRGRRIKRTGRSIANIAEDKKRREKIPPSEVPRERPPIDYNAILSKCGLYSQVELKMNDVEITVMTDIPYKELKTIIGGEYVESIGIMATVNVPHINWILDKALRVMYFRATNQESYERWSHKFRVGIEREMLLGAYSLSRNRISSEVN